MNSSHGVWIITCEFFQVRQIYPKFLNSSHVFRIYIYSIQKSYEFFPNLSNLSINFMYEFHVWISCMIFMYEFHVCIKLISCMYEIEFFRISFFPYPSWVQCTNQFLSTTTQTQFILIFIFFFLALSRPFQTKIWNFF